MISLDFAIFQVSRISGLPGWPRIAEAQKELVDALRNTARSEAHAKNAVDELVRSTRCPTPEEVIHTTWMLLTGEEQRRCPKCNNSGWVHFEKIINQVRYDFSARCRRCRPLVEPSGQQAGQKQKNRARSIFGSGDE